MSAILPIGTVARLAGVTPDTIRYYERLGLMPRPSRTPAGYRQYGDGAVRRLAVIRNAQRFGFSLKELAAFMQIRESGGTPCRQVRDAAQRILEAADRQITALMRARREMRRTLQAWDRRLAATPANQQARLLEQLTSKVTGYPRTRASRPGPFGPGSRQV
jgi:DNA-binding transcriptional MerR regulator